MAPEPAWGQEHGVRTCMHGNRNHNPHSATACVAHIGGQQILVREKQHGHEGKYPSYVIPLALGERVLEFRDRDQRCMWANRVRVTA